MQLFTARQIREWDNYTIQNEPVTSLDLMDRAASSFVDWFLANVFSNGIKVTVVCGNGNNGGDGLVIARHLQSLGADVSVYILRLTAADSPDFDVNLSRLLQVAGIEVHFVHEEIPVFDYQSVCIDALLGTGVSRKLEGNAASLVNAINGTGFQKIISVDMPSGLPADSLVQGVAVKADIIYTFQVPKISFFLPEHAPFCRQWVVGDIGLHPEYLEHTSSRIYLTSRGECVSWLRVRPSFSHKGTFGHAMIFAGGPGKTGAALLASHAAIRSGCGWVTAVVPSESVQVVHSSIPEVMSLSQDDLESSLLQAPPSDLLHSSLRVQKAWACGPGLGTDARTTSRLSSLFNAKPGSLVIDADALNILAAHRELLQKIPPHSILTPHPGEFKRLFGQTENSLLARAVLLEKAREYQVVIVLKGRYTQVALPDGTLWINSTGNPGMATAGCGDVLTGILVSLLAQGYPSWQAAVLGVYLHGLAGDLACAQQSEESLIASDIIRFLGRAFQMIRNAEG